METIFLILAIGATNLMAFFIGARVAQKVVNNEPLVMPELNPVTIYKNYKEQKQADIKLQRIEQSMENINNYTGDSTGQKDIN